MKTVYSYTSYRIFLNDCYQERKAKQRGYSYRAFSEAAGIQSPNYLKLIIDGSRDLTPNTIYKFAQALKLEFDEQLYFEALVYFDQASSDEERRFHSRKLERLRTNKPRRIERMTVNSLIKQWYYPAVWLALSGKGEGVAIREIATHVGISVDSAREAVEILKSAKAVYEEGGKFRLRADCIIHSDRAVVRRSQKRYLRAQLERSTREFDKRYGSGSKFYSHTFSTARQNLERFDQMVKDFLLEVNSASDQEPIEDILQMNIQLFPVGQKH